MNESQRHPISVAVLGATGAVGNHVALTLASMPQVVRLNLLGRRPAMNVMGKVVLQTIVDVLDPPSYKGTLEGYDAAICTLGVGQPSKMSKEEFVKIDHDAVLVFAAACKKSGVGHFVLLSSVGADVNSAFFYLQTKGKLEEALKTLRFERLSLFHPSMIVTPTNRYGISSAITLTLTRMLSPLLLGTLRKYRGIKVGTLGRAIAVNTVLPGEGLETLTWDQIMTLDSKLQF